MIRHLKHLLFLIILGTIVFKFNSIITTVNYGTMNLRIFPSVKHAQGYCVIYDYWKADDEYAKGPHITLVLHATAGYLNYLDEHFNTWTGGISVSIFIPTPRNQLRSDIDVLESQLYLRSVFSALSSPQAMKLKNSGQISLHLFFRNKHFISCPILKIPEDMYSILRASPSDMKDFEDTTQIYPINAARNIARKGSKTKLFISGDIEQVYVENFESRMYQLAKRVLLEFVLETPYFYNIVFQRKEEDSTCL